MKSDLKSLRKQLVSDLKDTKPGSAEREALISELEVVFKAENDNTRIDLENVRRQEECDLERVKWQADMVDKHQQQKWDNIVAAVNAASKFVVPLGMALIFASLERDGFIATKIYQMIPKSIKF